MFSICNDPVMIILCHGELFNVQGSTTSKNEKKAPAVPELFSRFRDFLSSEAVEVVRPSSFNFIFIVLLESWRRGQDIKNKNDLKIETISVIKIFQNTYLLILIM